MELIEQKLKTLTSYHGVIVNVRLDEARLPDGSTAKREVVEHPADLRIAIKADASTPYSVIKNVMNSLQDLRENRYNLITSLKAESEN